jgi:hypothetical protein
MSERLTITKIKFMHGECSADECPVCHWTAGEITTAAKIYNKKLVTQWLETYLILLPDESKPDSPWWVVENTNGDCYRKLQGDLRYPSYYTKNPNAQ